MKEDGTSVTNTRFIINAIYHSFEEARYELNAVEIDKNKNVGLTSLIKNYTSVYEAQRKFLENAGLFLSSNANILLTDPLIPTSFRTWELYEYPVTNYIESCLDCQGINAVKKA